MSGCLALTGERQGMGMGMGKGKAIPAWAYKAAIVVATIIWGYSFVAMKDVVSVLPPAWLLGFRFTFAGVLLTAILWKRVHKAFSGRMLLAGAALGLADFMAFWTQTIGLEHTTPGINAFLTATYCVIVPFLWWIVAHRRPTVFNIGAAVLALVGIWLVSVQSGGMTMGYGEAMTLLCALLFAVHAPAANTGGTLPIFASPRNTTPRPFTWSPCSCVTNMAWIRPGSKPASSQRLRKSRLQMPQSISTPAPVAVFSITAAFPELPLANTCNASMSILRELPS